MLAHVARAAAFGVYKRKDGRTASNPLGNPCSAEIEHVLPEAMLESRVTDDRGGMDGSFQPPCD